MFGFQMILLEKLLVYFFYHILRSNTSLQDFLEEVIGLFTITLFDKILQQGDRAL